MKKDFRQSVQRAMDSCFSGMQADPFLAQKIINDKEEKPVKRKLTLATVLVTLLIMLAVTALAMGVYEAIKPAMDQSAPLLLGEDWGLENKLRFVEVLRAYGIVADGDEQLAVCMDASVSDDRREEAASILIDRVYGALMREQLDPTILQPEEYNTPGLETVFTVFYRSVSPDADQTVISAEFEKWFEESGLFEPAGEAATYQRSEKATEEYVRQLCLSELSEIHSFSKKERQATEITIRFDDEAGLWIADFFVEAEQLRPALRAEWGESYFDPAQKAYHWTKLFRKRRENRRFQRRRIRMESADPAGGLSALGGLGVGFAGFPVLFHRGESRILRDLQARCRRLPGPASGYQTVFSGYPIGICRSIQPNHL